MPYVIPPDTHVPGDLGHTTDHNNMSDVFAALDNAYLSSYQAPTGATAETQPRGLCTNQGNIQTSGTLYVRAISMKQNTVVNNITFAVDATVEAAGTHGWYVLLDSGRVVRAVTADQTGAAFWGAANTLVTLPTNAYTTAYSGLYYVGVMVAATTPPRFTCGIATATALVGAAPVLYGTSSTGQTTPPTTGTTMAALVSAGASNWNFYAYTS